MRAVRLGLGFAVAGVAAAMTACGPGADDRDPRDRQGGPGAATWRLVADGAGHAAFLSRPGAAPDLVIWCRGDGRVTLRAHVFEAPARPPKLSLSTDAGSIAFEGARVQGGLRDVDRKLVEGATALTEETAAVLAAAARVDVTDGATTWRAAQADPQAVMAGFARDCLAGG